MQFQILSLHHVNKLAAKQCSHHCQWLMVSDVDIAVDTQSNLPEAGTGGTKPEMTNSMTTKQSQYRYWLHLNKQMARLSDNIYSIWNCPGNDTRVFCFFWEAKQQGLETQTEETIVHSAVRGHIAVQLPSRMAFHNASTASVLEAGRILKLFPRVDRRIQGSGLTHRFWPKAVREVRVCHASTQSCTVVTGEVLARHKALWLNCGFSRLMSISSIVL